MGCAKHFNTLGQKKASLERRHRKGLLPEVRDLVRKLVQDQPDITGKPALEHVLQSFPDLDESAQKKVKNLVNTLKTKKKKEEDRL